MTATVPTPIFRSKLEWSVQRRDFDTPEGSKQFIKSKEFRATPNSEVSWELHLFPRSNNQINSEFVGLFLGASNISDPVRVKYTLGLIARDGTEHNRKFMDKTFTQEDKKGWFDWGFSNFIRRAELFDPTKNLLWDDQVVVFCDLEVHWKQEVPVPECSLSNDWSELLESGEFSDAVLVVGGEEIKAHKLVLSARSPVFAAMFKHDMQESRTGRVVIEDLDVVGVKGFLRFVYSGEVKDLKAIAEKVLPAADKYGVERLKVLCEKEICEKLSIENVSEMLRLAELHTAKKLKAGALSFMSLNAGEVVDQDNLWDLADVNQDLLREAVCFFSHLKTGQNSDGPQVKRRRLN